MEEVLFRRFRRWKAYHEEGEKVGKAPDLAFSILPDLLLVDGGKGQLSRSGQGFRGIQSVGSRAVAGLAKQGRRACSSRINITPSILNAIHRDSTSSSDCAMKRTVSPSLRTANGASKQGLASRLDVIPGVGPARRQALLKKFGSVKGIKAAPAGKDR